MTGEPLENDEIVVRWITPAVGWYEPPDRPTTSNFKLRRGGRGLSVYRFSVVSTDELVQRFSLPVDVVFLSASSKAIRALRNGAGQPLGLDIVENDPDGTNPGHALIVSPSGGKFSAAVSKALRDLFWSSRHDT